MRHSSGGIGGGIGIIWLNKSCCRTELCDRAFGDLPLRHRPVPGGPHRTTGIDFSLLKSNT